MVLNGRATEALTFYQEAFAGDILFKITNQEFKERLNPSLTIPAGEEHWLSLDFTNGHFSITTS